MKYLNNVRDSFDQDACKSSVKLTHCLDLIVLHNTKIRTAS